MLNDDISIYVQLNVITVRPVLSTLSVLTGANSDCSAVLCLEADCDRPIPPLPGQCCSSCPPEGENDSYYNKKQRQV